MIGRFQALVTVLLLAFPLPGRSQLEPQASAVRQDAQASLTKLTKPTTFASSLLYAFPESAMDGAEHRLDFVLTGTDIPKVTESLVFGPIPDAAVGRPVVEAFSLHPRLLASLRENIHSQDLRISVYLDGHLRDEPDFTDFINDSERLRQQNLFLVDVKLRSDEGRNRESQPFAKLTNAGCVSQCQQTYTTCDNNCLRNPNPICESHCDSQHSACLQSCNCPVVTQDWTTTTVFSDVAGPLPLRCLSDGNYYRQYTRTYKNEHYQTVAQCDGDTTQGIVGVYYTTKTCWKITLPGPCIPYPYLPPIEQLCIE